MSNEKLKRYGITVVMAALISTVGVGLCAQPNSAQTANQPVASAAMTCPKCNGPMEEGIIGNYGNGWWTDEWRAENPNKHSLSRESKKIKAFRCTSCGYLEAYAK